MYRFWNITACRLEKKKLEMDFLKRSCFNYNLSCLTTWSLIYSFRNNFILDITSWNNTFHLYLLLIAWYAWVILTNNVYELLFQHLHINSNLMTLNSPNEQRLVKSYSFFRVLYCLIVTIFLCFMFVMLNFCNNLKLIDIWLWRDIFIVSNSGYILKLNEIEESIFIEIIYT